MIKNLYNILIMILLPFLSMAQDSKTDDFFNSLGKIYVVVAVIVILFVGILSFLFFLERRIKKLEEEIDN